MSFVFEWDEAKAAKNLSKHKVSFEEGATVLQDSLSISIIDKRYLDGETRFIDIGRSSIGRLLVVVYVERQERIRLISSRKATSRERRIYQTGNIF